MESTWNVIGHSAVTEQLAEAAKTAQPHHAYLFTGVPNLGKVTVARLFARALLCENEAAPCGHCRQCLLQAAGNHPDYFELPRDESLKIEHIRDLKKALSLKPHSAAFRIGLIPDADRLGLPAQNALLKLLEEPPGRTVLILTAPSAEALLPTTVSRCRHLSFTVPPIDELLAAFKQQGPRVDEAIQAADRRPGLTLAFLADPERLDRKRTWQETLLAIVDGGVAERLGEAKRLAKDESLPEILDCWLSVHRQALHGELGTTEAISDAAKHLARLYSQAQLTRNLEALFAAKQRLGYNPNVLLMLENLLIKLGT